LAAYVVSANNDSRRGVGLVETMPGSHSFRAASNILFELFILACTALPILILIYWYPSLPDRVPEYLTLRGEVSTWSQKSVASVFRLPLMAIDLQALCLLAKYGVWQAGISKTDLESAKSSKLTFAFVDWLRAVIAVKLGASSLEAIVFSVERYQHLSVLTRAISWTSSLAGIVIALCYLYRLLKWDGKQKPFESESERSGKSIAYFDPADSSWLSSNHRVNFGNKWTYLFILCLTVLPLLMFWPMLID